MKKRNKLSQTVIFILIFPIAVLMCLFFLFYIPIDYIRYLLSNYRKDMNKRYGKKSKYTWLATMNCYFRVYELIAKYNLPIQYFLDQSRKMCTYGYFFYKGTLLIVDVVPHYDSETQKWYIVKNDDEMDLQIYMDSEKEEFAQYMSANLDFVCDNVVFLVNENEFYDEEKEHLKNVDFILPYSKKNFAGNIESFFS